MITQKEVIEMFEYESEGRLRRRNPARKSYPWRKIGKDGRYLATCLPGSGKTEYLHRLVFLYHHGYMPENVDHIDRDTSNNRIENLRAASCAQNQYNGRRKANNRSGYKGVVYAPMYRSKWKAKITVNKKIITIGYFETPEEAHAAYCEAAERYAKEFAFSG